MASNIDKAAIALMLKLREEVGEIRTSLQELDAERSLKSNQEAIRRLRTSCEKLSAKIEQIQTTLTEARLKFEASLADARISLAEIRTRLEMDQPNMTINNEINANSNAQADSSQRGVGTRGYMVLAVIALGIAAAAIGIKLYLDRDSIQITPPAASETQDEKLGNDANLDVISH